MPKAQTPCVRVAPDQWLAADELAKSWTKIGQRFDRAGRRRDFTAAAVIADAITLGLRELARTCPVPE